MYTRRHREALSSHKKRWMSKRSLLNRRLRGCSLLSSPWFRHTPNKCPKSRNAECQCRVRTLQSQFRNEPLHLSSRARANPFPRHKHQPPCPPIPPRTPLLDQHRVMLRQVRRQIHRQRSHLLIQVPCRFVTVLPRLTSQWKKVHHRPFRVASLAAGNGRYLYMWLQNMWTPGQMLRRAQ